ncbi:ECF RNA polymerase sigma factor SigE [Planctomycetes bacterium Pla163]|uniref:RNA polymerase sigma factor n=1 Tax=Rohdeia mirabilis TaxID=2528008 RepID=A0A518D386_9BACT|nr:ECF RNA polymerase sigma factor SigE [Planctomycetes bacterium Pla163]
MPAERPRDEDFRAYVERGDVEALARFFDAAAPRLLLVAAHVAPAGVEAEDLVQQTFLEALRGQFEPRPDATALSWLASILRRRAIDEHRRAHRSREKSLEAQHDRPGREPDPVERLADDEAFELVVIAIDALESPQREVVSLRLVHGMDPATIAHTLGRQPGTVRMQLKRGLERLRDALPAGIATLLGAFVGGRALEHVRAEVLDEALRLTPDPSAPTDATATTRLGPWNLLRTLAMNHPLVTLSLPLVLAALPWMLAPEPQASNEPIALTEEAHAPPAPTSAPATMALIEEAESREAVPNASATPPPATDGPLIVGRVVDRNGAPLADATLTVEVEEPRVPGEPRKRTTLPEVEVEDDGTFSFDTGLASPQELRFSVRSPGRPRLSLWTSLEGSETTIQVGDIRFPPTGTLQGTVLSPDGSTIPWPESITVKVLGSDWSANEVLMTNNVLPPVTHTPTSGTQHSFVVENVPAGRIQYMVESSTHAAGDMNFWVAADEVTRLDVVWTDQDPRGSIKVRFRESASNMVSSKDAAGLTFRLLLDDGSEREPDRSWYGGAEFHAVPMGLHTVAVDHPAYEPVSVQMSPLAEWQEIALVGAAAVRLRVVGVDGERVETYSVYATPVQLAFPLGTDLHPNAEADGDAVLYAAVPCIDQLWIVVLPTGERRTVALEGLARGETRDVTLDFGQGPNIRGTVRDPDGAPLAGVHVEARPRLGWSIAHFDVQAPYEYTTDRQRLHLNAQPQPLLTDENGRFAFEGVLDDTYDVLAHTSPWNYASTTWSAQGADLDLLLPPTRTLLVHRPNPLSGSESEPESSNTFRIDVRASSTTPLTTMRKSGAWREELDDGTIAFHGLPHEAIDVLVTYPRSVGNAAGPSVRTFVAATVPAESNDGEAVTVDTSGIAPASLALDLGIVGSQKGALGLYGVLVASPITTPPVQLAVPIDPDGRARYAFVPPGTWDLYVTPQMDGIGNLASPIWKSPLGRHAFVSGAAVELSPQLEFATKALGLVDPAGTPLAQRSIWFGQGGTKVMHTTDGEGRIELSLPPGSYTLELRSEDPDAPITASGPQATFEWTVDGPLDDTLTLEPPATD